MAGATSKLQILLEAKNEASSTLKQVQNDAGGLSKALAGVGAAFGIGFSAQAITSLAETGIEMAREAAEAERLGNSFEILAGQAGQSADAMLSAMQVASKGTISNSELMLQANTAMMLGVADSAEEMASLLEVASARGKAFGVSTADAFAALTEGLGRMSPEVLNNIGIVINAQKTYADYADQIDRSVESLTDAEKKQALVNAVIQNSKGIVDANKGAADDAATSFERMDAAATNAKEAVGQVFSGPVIIGASILTDYLNGQIKMLNTEVTALKSAYEAVKGFVTGEQAMISSVDEANKHFGIQVTSAADAARALAALGNQAEETGAKLLDMGADGRAAMEQFNMALGLIQDIDSQISSAASQSGALFGAKQGGDAGLARQKDVSAELEAQRQTWEDMHYTTKEIDEVLMPAYISNLHDADQATFRVATGTAKISDEARAAKQAFDDLTNTVAGVLSGALDPGVGVNPDDILPRADAINEDARRLADVAVNGFASPWLEYFRSTFPDLFQEMAASNDIKQGAALMLRNFQDGLEPELINKETAKERVRKMLIGDQNMAALATEIAGELATEMGIPMQQALAAAQGTLGTGGGGTEMATQFSDAALQQVGDSNTGGSIVDTTITQMRARFPLLATAGTDAAKTWGDAFLAKVGDSVPPALINLLTDLVTPAVVSRMAQRGTLTGATP